LMGIWRIEASARGIFMSRIDAIALFQL
jgi:hypothetical protein